MTGIEVGIAIIVGILLGRLLPNRRERPRPPEPICGCGHHHGYHDPGTGCCHARVEGEPTKFDRYPSRGPVAWEQVQCACRTYSGPVPLPEYFAPEVASGGPS